MVEWYEDFVVEELAEALRLLQEANELVLEVTSAIYEAEDANVHFDHGWKVLIEAAAELKRSVRDAWTASIVASAGTLREVSEASGGGVSYQHVGKLRRLHRPSDERVRTKRVKPAKPAKPVRRSTIDEMLDQLRKKRGDNDD